MKFKKKFKSYYVVWKQRKYASRAFKYTCLNRTMQYGNRRSPPKILFPREQFKSYYVVWKPSCFCLFFVFFSMFKSYYVVWKLFLSGKSTKAHCSGLNRTMQYGNFRNAMSGIFSFLFKSYYVVWKLQRNKFYAGNFWVV